MIDPIIISVNRLEEIVNGLIEVIEIQKDGEGAPKLIEFEKVFKSVLSDLKKSLSECF